MADIKIEYEHHDEMPDDDEVFKYLDTAQPAKSIGCLAFGCFGILCYMLGFGLLLKLICDFIASFL